MMTRKPGAVAVLRDHNGCVTARSRSRNEAWRAGAARPRGAVRGNLEREQARSEVRMDQETLERIVAVTIAEGTLAERMGIKICSASGAEVVATMPVAGNIQPYG